MSTFTKSVARNAAKYDSIIVVGTEIGSMERIEKYRVLGVPVEYFPLRVGDAPTIISALGLLGWLFEKSRRVNLLVELELEDALIPSIILMGLKGLGLDESLETSRSSGFALFSPLEARLLVILDVMRREGISLLEEATVFKEQAFTGGDAHLASVIEFIIEHYIHLRGLLPLSLTRLYNYVKTPSQTRRLTDAEKLVADIADSLDYSLSGAVRAVAVRLAEGMEVYVGCTLLLREDSCWPEVFRASTYYERLARMLGASRVNYYMSSPEDLACMAYGYIDPELCGGEQ